MYAKLVTGATDTTASVLIRDIVALCVSADPSIDDLSGSGFNTSSSVVIDNTPAGWTYVNSSADGSTLGSGSTPAANYDWWGIKAPCLAPANTFKFAVFSISYRDSPTTNASFWLQGASDIATGSATLTNRGSHGYMTLAGSPETTMRGDTYMAFSTAGSQTFHLVATPRFVLLIKEGIKYSGIFEHSVTELHEFYNTAPFLQLNNSTSTTTSAYAVPGSLGGNRLGGTNGEGNAPVLEIFNFTNPSTTTNYGVLSFGAVGQYGWTASTSLAGQPYIWPSSMATTLSATGATRNTLKPMLLQGFSYGLPTCWITGISDIWMTRGSAGTTGDTMSINGQTYTYFNAVSSAAPTKATGFAINTSQIE